jgi:uncharacterized protein (DUF488 family)
MTTKQKNTKPKLTCVSIGYQGRKVQDLCAELKTHGVELLLDVRQAAWSHRPEFRKQALAAALAKHGVAYLHMREAGNPFRPRKGEVVSVAECAKHYRRHLAKTPEVVSSVAATLRSQTTAVFCFESQHEHCHRSVLLAAVAAQDPLQVDRLDGVAKPAVAKPKRRKQAR